MLISSSYHKDIRKINTGGANSDADIISGDMLCWLFFKSQDGRRAQFPTNYSFHVLRFMQFVWMYYGVLVVMKLRLYIHANRVSRAIRKFMSKIRII